MSNIKINDSLFVRAEVETTSICNRKCSYCPNKFYKRPQKFMSDMLFYKIIDDLHKLNFSGKVSPHFYGEPLLDKRIFDFLNYTRKQLPLASIHLFTNGDFLTIDVVNRLMKIGVDRIRISQHDNILAHHLQDLLQKVDSVLKAKIIIVKYFNNQDILMNRGGLIPLAKKKKNTCSFVNNLTIDFEGNVVLCCNDYFSKYTFGNVTKNSINSIWNDPAYRDTRNKIINGNWFLPICKICSLQ